MNGGIENPGSLAFFAALIDGRLKLGQTITQDELCQVLGLTLSRMREVTVLLEAEGLIQVKKRVGLTIFYPDVRFVGSTFQYREILECEGLRRFAEMVTEDWTDRMLAEHQDVIELVKRHPDPQFFAGPVGALETRFHESFINAFANDQISINYRRNSQKMYLLRLLNPDAVGPSNTIKSMLEHVEVVEALTRRDAAAAVEALQRHFKNVLHRILTH
jgi:DNA-binding GntR family transcriptional regulator